MFALSVPFESMVPSLMLILVLLLFLLVGVCSCVCGCLRGAANSGPGQHLYALYATPHEILISEDGSPSPQRRGEGARCLPCEWCEFFPATGQAGSPGRSPSGSPGGSPKSAGSRAQSPNRRSDGQATPALYQTAQDGQTAQDEQHETAIDTAPTPIDLRSGSSPSSSRNLQRAAIDGVDSRSPKRRTPGRETPRGTPSFSSAGKPPHGIDIDGTLPGFVGSASPARPLLPPIFAEDGSLSPDRRQGEDWNRAPPNAAARPALPAGPGEPEWTPLSPPADEETSGTPPEDEIIPPPEVEKVSPRGAGEVLTPAPEELSSPIQREIPTQEPMPPATNLETLGGPQHSFSGVAVGEEPRADGDTEEGGASNRAKKKKKKQKKNKSEEDTSKDTTGS